MLSEAVGTLLFYVFAAMACGLAIATVTSERILRAAVYLMGVLSVSAGFYLLLGAEFLAGIQVLVYVGGIVVLLVFAVMLTRPAELREDRPSLGRRLLALAAGEVFFGFSLVMIRSTEFATSTANPAVQDNTAEIGKRLLDYGSTGYVLPFELISLLLLAAVIGSIVLARKIQEGKEASRA